MKRLLLLGIISLFLLGLAACGGEKEKTSKSFDFTVEDLEGRINDALKQMGDKTNLKIASNEVLEDGRNVIALSDNIYFYVTTDDSTKKVSEVTLGATNDAYLTEKEDLDFSFLLLVGTVDDSLVAGDRSKVVAELGLMDKNINIMDHTEVYNNNDIQYTYKGDLKDDAIILQAKPK